MRGALPPPQSRITPRTFVSSLFLVVFFGFFKLLPVLFVFVLCWYSLAGAGAPSVKAGGGGAASSTRLKLEPHGAHHLTVALIQPPLQSNASPHSHITCAFSYEKHELVFYRFIECAYWLKPANISI